MLKLLRLVAHFHHVQILDEGVLLLFPGMVAGRHLICYAPDNVCETLFVLPRKFAEVFLGMASNLSVGSCFNVVGDLSPVTAVER